MKVKTFLAVVILPLIFQGIACAAAERWVDQNGVRDTPSAQKPQIDQIASAAVSPPPAREKSDAVSNPGAAVPQVELYVTSWCPYCKKAENFFRSQGIPFTAYDIEKDSSAARRKEQLDSSKGVPLAIINGQMIRGYSESAYREALKKKP